MNLNEKFDRDLFNLINSYENRYNISLEQIELIKDRDALGEKVIDVKTSFNELEVAKEQEKKSNFLTHVLLPTIVLFFVLSTILDFINS